MRKYLSVMRIAWGVAREHAVDFFGRFLIFPISILLLYLIWNVIFSYTPDIGGFSMKTMINYYLAVSLMLLSYRRFWAIHYNVFSDINEGNLSIYLARPIDYQFQWLARMVATLSINVLFTLPVLVISSFLMQLPLPNMMSLLLFFISIYLSAAVLFFIQFCIGTLSFWTERIFATRDLLLNIQNLFSGAIVPLALFPSIIQEISNYLPFRSIYFVPASIYAGYFSNIEALYNLGIQVFWVFFLFVLSRSFFNKGLVKFDAKGG